MAAAQGCPPAALADPIWLGNQVEPARAGTRRFLTDLSLPVRERSRLVLFKKAAYVDLGPIRATPDGCTVEISWQSASLAPLFPVFAGRLTLSGDEVTLEGFYAPPGGEVGMVLDRAFLNIAARGTGRWFLGRIAEALAAKPVSHADFEPSATDATGTKVSKTDATTHQRPPRGSRPARKTSFS